MKPYNPLAPCTMCEGKQISTNYDKDLHAMKRECSKCGYKWNEEPVTPKPISEDTNTGEQLLLG